jgi:type I restriction enzyme M protein
MAGHRDCVATSPLGDLFKTAPLAFPVTDNQTIKRLAARASSLLRSSLGGGIIERLDDVIKCLVAKLFDEAEVSKGKSKPDFAVWDERESVTVRYERVGALYGRAVAAYCRGPAWLDQSKREFCRDQRGVARIVELFHPYRFGDSFHDIKGSAFQEILRDTLDKNDNQQFFTPAEVAEFMADLATAAVGKPLHHLVVCDPAVGSGGLLAAVVRRAIACLNGSSTRDKVRRYVQAKTWGADCDERMAWIAAMNLLLLAGDPGNILLLPGGGSLDRSARSGDGRRLEDGSMDLIVTNPPFGADLIDPGLLNQWDLGRSRAARRRSVLFVERCVSLLKPGGVCVIVLDDSVLSQRTTCDVRAWLLHRADPLAVFSLPDTAFMPYATAKASVVVFRRKGRNGATTTAGTPATLMVEVEQTGRKPNGEPLYASERDNDGRLVVDTDLPEAAKRFEAFMAGDWQGPHTDERPLTFVVSTRDLQRAGKRDSEAQQDSQAAEGPRLDVLRYHPMQLDAEKVIAHARFPVVRIGDLVDVRSARVNPLEAPEETFRYIGLAEIEKFTGEWSWLELRGDSIKSSCNLCKGGDIVFARLRPNLRKAILLPDDDPGGVCSSECAVLRAHDKGSLEDRAVLFDAAGPDVDSEYLVWMLRSDLVQGQILAHVTGVGRPRIATSALLAVRIPLPPIDQQRSMAAEMRTIWKRYVHTRRKALDALAGAEKELIRTFGSLGHLVSG